MGIRAARAYSEQVGGQSFILGDADTGEIIWEEYPNGGTATTAHDLQSCTKAFAGPVWHAMVEDGYWGGLCRTASKYIDHWQTDPRYSAIALRDLCWETAGLISDNDHVGGQGNNPVPDFYEHVRRYPIDTPHLIDGVPIDPLSHDVGTFFRYGPVPYYVLAEAQRQTFEANGIPLNYVQYLSVKFFTPLGVAIGDWDYDSGPNKPNTPNGAHLTARNLLRWAMFMGGDGTIPPGSIGTGAVGDRLLSEQRMNVIRKGSAVNPGHGYSTWTNNKNGFNNNYESAPAGSPGGHLYHDGEPNAVGGLGGQNGRHCWIYLPEARRILIRNDSSETLNTFDVNTWITWFFA